MLSQSLRWDLKIFDILPLLNCNVGVPCHYVDGVILSITYLL